MTGRTGWLTVIGMGDDGPDGLSAQARRSLDEARILFGGARHLALVETAARKIAWRSPIEESIAEIEKVRPEGPVVVLASGDPSWFGVARLLGRHFPPGEMAVLPAPSAFSLAAARLGWALEETRCLSACGRPVETVWPHLRPGARLLVLSAGAGTPEALAAGLARRGYGPSALHVMEHLGGAAERVRETRAAAFDLADVAALNLVAVHCEAEPETLVPPSSSGFADELFLTDGTMTKRPLRALALSSLAPRPGELLWDIGAGSGSIAIEWLRAVPDGHAVAVEPREDRRALIAANAERFCVRGLDIHAGRAPEVFAGLPSPDAVFVGGGLTEAVAERAVGALRPGGRLVAHGVTLETMTLLATLHELRGGELMRVGVETAEPLGAGRGWRPAMPVAHWRWTKPEAA